MKQNVVYSAKNSFFFWGGGVNVFHPSTPSMSLPKANSHLPS